MAMGRWLIFPNARGFSILGIIIAAGMASGLAMTLANITRDQQVVQRRTESYFEISNLSYLIFRTLENSEACTQTLGRGTAIRNSARWTAIKNKDGGIVLDKSEKYGNGLVKIQSMAPKNIQITGNTGEMVLQVTFKKLGSVDGENTKTVKTFPLSIDVDASRKLIRCRSNYTNIVTTAKERMCRMINGVFDPVEETCDLANLVLDGQKKTCGNMGGAFNVTPPDCDMNSFVQDTVKAICLSVQGTYNETTAKCMLSSSAPPKQPDEDKEEELKFNDPYPICNPQYGVALQTKGSRAGKVTFSSCFGPEVGKLFKTITSEHSIAVRTAPWISHWFQFDSDGALESINFYRRISTRSLNTEYENKVYYNNADPMQGRLPAYRLINKEVKMLYAKTGKWYTFTFSTRINYPHPPPPVDQLENIDKSGSIDWSWLEGWP